MGPGCGQALGVAVADVAGAEETDHGHAGSTRAGDASGAILQHDAGLRGDAQASRGMQENIGGRLAVRHVSGAEKAPTEVVTHTELVDAVVQPLVRTRRGNTARNVEMSFQEGLEARNRPDVAPHHGFRASPVCILEALRQGGSYPFDDRFPAVFPALAHEEADRIVEARRLAEAGRYAVGQQGVGQRLAVGDHAVEIEDQQAGHGAARARFGCHVASLHSYPIERCPHHAVTVTSFSICPVLIAHDMAAPL